MWRLESRPASGPTVCAPRRAAEQAIPEARDAEMPVHFAAAAYYTELACSCPDSLPYWSAPMRRHCSLIALLFLVATVDVARAEPAVDFAADVRPIFERHCFKCHGPEKQHSGYRLDVRSRALAGGESGEAAIVAGKAANSPLLARITSDDEALRMPPEGVRLAVRDIELVKSWIDAGAPWPDDLAGEARLKKQHWAFQAPVRPELP